RSGGTCGSADPSWKCFSTERTRISCHAALETTACAAFSKESRMKFARATNIYRKSGVAEWRDLRFRGPFVEMFFDRVPGFAILDNPQPDLSKLVLKDASVQPSPRDSICKFWFSHTL